MDYSKRTNHRSRYNKRNSTPKVHVRYDDCLQAAQAALICEFNEPEIVMKLYFEILTREVKKGKRFETPLGTFKKSKRPDKIIFRPKPEIQEALNKLNLEWQEHYKEFKLLQEYGTKPKV